MTLTRRAVVSGIVTAAITPGRTRAQPGDRGRRVGIFAQARAIRDDLDGVLKRVLAERPQAIVLLTAPVVFSSLGRIAELTHRSRMPSITPFSTYASAGGLMAYGPDFPSMWRQLAVYVDRVLRGARAGDLPVERPSKVSLIINLKTARHIGLTVPQSLVFRADEVIQ